MCFSFLFFLVSYSNTLVHFFSIHPDDPVEKEKKEQAEKQALEQEKQMQKTIIGIKKRFGKNAILKGMNLQEGATAMERNGQVGGHKA